MKQSELLVAIGSNCIDEYYQLDRIPEQGDKVLVNMIQKSVGGMIGNAASVYANYSHPTVMFDVLKPGEETDFILKSLQEHGIDTKYIEFDNTLLSNGKCLIMLYEGERTIYVLNNNSVKRILSDNQREILKQTAYVYTTISDLKSWVGWDSLLDQFTENDIDLILDVEASTLDAYDEDLTILKNASYLFINEYGYKFLLEKYGQDFIEYLLNQKAKAVVLTIGSEGCRVITSDTDFTKPGISVKIADTTGAGDTFNASFVHGLSKGWALEACAEFANSAAARSIQFLGAKSGVVSEDDVIEFMNLLEKTE